MQEYSGNSWKAEIVGEGEGEIKYILKSETAWSFLGGRLREVGKNSREDEGKDRAGQEDRAGQDKTGQDRTGTRRPGTARRGDHCGIREPGRGE